MLTPELLSPAGSLKNMRYAFAYGADAVYAGQLRYSLRVREAFPFMPIHLSVQANAVNWATVKFWQQARPEPSHFVTGTVP